MNCDEAQDLLNSLIDNELPPYEAEAVEVHLQHCGKCQREHRLIADLHKTLAELPRYPVPDSLAIQVTERIASLDGKQLPAHRWVRWATLTGTHAAAALFGAAVLFSMSPFLDYPTPSSDDIIAVHVRSLMKQNLTQVTAGDSHTVKPWFAGKIDYAPPVHDLAAEGFPLIGGRVDQLNGQKVAVLVYRRRKHWINLFIAVATAGSQYNEPVRRDRNGYTVVSAQQGDFVYWAVSDLSPEELAEFLKLMITNTTF